MTSNICSVTPDQAITQLQWASRNPDISQRTWMFIGAPGVGKTSFVTEFSAWRCEEAAKKAEQAGDMDRAARMRAGAKDPFGTKMMRLLVLNNMDPADVGGMRFLDHDARETITYRPEWMPAENNDDPIVIFVDEITTVDKHLQATVYSLLNERRIGSYRLHKNVMIIAAGNGTEHGAISYDMSSAVWDRMIVQDIHLDVAAWLKWATRNNVHPAVCSYVKMNPADLETCQQRVKQSLTVSASPRGWEDVSKLCYGNDAEPTDRTLLRHAIAGRLGEQVSGRMFLLYEQAGVLLDLERMLRANNLREIRELLPKDTDEHIQGKLNMLCFSMNNLANETTISKIADIFYCIYTMESKKIAAKEIVTAGYEMVMQRIIKNPAAVDALFATKSYTDYEAAREAQGLTQKIG